MPQLKDWIDAWADASSTTSFLKQARIRQKKSEARVTLGLRKRLRKQIRVIAEVLRQQQRQALTAATCISLAVDSRGKYKVLRFRCDTEHRPYFSDGVMGVFRCGYDSLQDAVDDHGDRMRRNLQGCITRFWTLVGTQTHMHAEEQAMLAKVRCLASDGGSSERKFITELVRRQAKRGCVFNAGPKQLLVWGQCSGADVQEISSRVSYMR